MGKLFDESGTGLTPSHAVKGDRRYRYYVSRSLMKGPAVRDRAQHRGRCRKHSRWSANGDLRN
jgi:hypothetical protein